MIHRKDLTVRFEWLAGSRFYEEALDEALVAIAFAARGRGDELVEYGAAWMMASGVVEVFGLEDLVEKAHEDLLPFLRSPSSAGSTLGERADA